MADGSMVTANTEALLGQTGPQAHVAAIVPGAVPCRLHELAVGAVGIVGGPTSYDPTVIRLLEMGLTPGTEVTLSRRAPGSDPIEIQVRGTRLCLRRADAARFPVTVR